MNCSNLVRMNALRFRTRYYWQLPAALVICLLQAAVVCAQPSVQWATIGSTPGEDTPYDIALASDGTIYVAGTFNVHDGGWGDTVLFTFDVRGTQISSHPSRGEL